MIPINNFLVLSAILFSLGIYGVLARRNAVLILMSVELMLKAVSDQLHRLRRLPRRRTSSPASSSPSS